MINTQTIEQFVETQSSTCREVFSSLVSNKSDTTQSLLKNVAETKIVQYAKLAGLSVGVNWQKDLSEVLSIEDLFLIIEAENRKEANTLSARLVKIFRPLLNVLIGYVTDVNLNALPLEQQMEAGDGLFLAALHVSYQ